MAVQNFDQTLMMQRIRETVPGHISFVDEIAELLGITNDSAYRRISGKTDLNIREIAAICKHFKFSFDTFTGNMNNSVVSFSHHQLNSHVNTFKEYLLNIKTDLMKILSFPEQERQIIFAAEDIPIFHHFIHPVLTTFKIFYWNRSILNTKDFEDKKFGETMIDIEVIQIAEEIYDLYTMINSIEIWSDDTINSTLKQIEFYWDSGVFRNKKDALKVCEEVHSMFARIYKLTELNVKLDKNDNPASNEKNYAFYHSDIMIGTNCVLATMSEQKCAYISYHTFNIMPTDNPGFCNETDLWLKNLIRKSNLISGVAEKQRYRYFKKINDALNGLIEKIERD